MKQEKEKTQKQKQLVTYHFKTEYRSGEIEFHYEPSPPRYERGALTTTIRTVTNSADGGES